MKTFYFDLETTGTKHWKNGIHQISGIIEIDGEIKDTFDIKVRPNPNAEIEQSALDVCGVTKDQIMEYPPMEDVFPLFEKMLSKYVSKFEKTDKFFQIGYNNSSFDNQFLRAWFVQNAKTPKDAEYGNYFGSWFWSSVIDVMVLAAEHLKHERHLMIDFKLMTVARHMGIEIDDSRLHDALYDNMLTKAIYDRICTSKLAV